MASKSISPTGTLFRRSRLFSLPPPLRKPQGASEEIQATHSHGTHATFHPTHAAIETPPSSLGRGDWGLKRSLPLRTTTASSNPVIRIDNIDSQAHIVDFDSASDHAMTLRKVQDMSLPVMRPNTSQSIGFQNVFDGEELSTRTPAHSSRRSRQGPRWRYEGPFLAGLETEKFDAYVERTVRKRRKEFLRFLWDRVVERRKRDGVRKAMEEGTAQENATLSLREFAAALVQLRQEGTELWLYIREFFDLSDQMLFAAAADTNVEGPLSTHPSAGLSYLRTNAVTPNHPVFGPAMNKPPVPARALADKFDRVIMSRFDRLGVGGITARGESAYSSAGTTDATSYGGSKMLVQPQHATVDAKGRVDLKIDRSHEDYRYIWKDVAYTETAAGGGKQKSRSSKAKPFRPF